jgi:hypothetical protein
MINFVAGCAESCEGVNNRSFATYASPRSEAKPSRPWISECELGRFQTAGAHGRSWALTQSTFCYTIEC